MRGLAPPVLPLALRSVQNNMLGVVVQWGHCVSPAGRMRAAPQRAGALLCTHAAAIRFGWHVPGPSRGALVVCNKPFPHPTQGAPVACCLTPQRCRPAPQSMLLTRLLARVQWQNRTPRAVLRSTVPKDFRFPSKAALYADRFPGWRALLCRVVVKCP